MKKKLSIFLIAIVLFVSLFSLTGCGINPAAEEYEENDGFIFMPFSDGENYYAGIEFSTYDRLSTLTTADNYLFNVLSTQFEVQRDDGYPQVLVSTLDYYGSYYYTVSNDDSAEGFSVFSYTIKLTKDEMHWFDYDLSYGFLNITAICDYENPLASFFTSGSKLNSIYSLLKYGNATFDRANEHFDSFNIDETNAKLLVPVRNTINVTTGTVIYDSNSRSHYYQISGLFGQMESSRAIYTYTVMASYGWFTLAVIIGTVVTLLIILLAKKKEGRLVDLKRRPRGFGGNPYDGHAGGGYGGYVRRETVDPFTPDQPNGENNDNIFDGF